MGHALAQMPLRCIGSRLDLHQHVERTDVLALAAADTQLLVDGVDALGVLGDGLVLTDRGALAALDADHGLGRTLEFDDLDAGLVRIKFLVEGVGTCADAFQTCHTGGALFDSEFLHDNSPLCHNL